MNLQDKKYHLKYMNECIDNSRKSENKFKTIYTAHLLTIKKIFEDEIKAEESKEFVINVLPKLNKQLYFERALYNIIGNYIY
jgi:hypothetical protein